MMHYEEQHLLEENMEHLRERRYETLRLWQTVELINKCPEPRSWWAEEVMMRIRARIAWVMQK